MKGIRSSKDASGQAKNLSRGCEIRSKQEDYIMKRKIVRLVSSFLIFPVLVFPAPLMAAPYYQGKVITCIVGHQAGGGNDIVARVIAKHLPKFIPGKPPVIIQNMPGASGVIAANYVYNQTKPDGLTILATDRLLATPQLFKVESVKYDLTKFSWIGSAAVVACCLYIRTSLPYKSFSELKAMNPIYIGSTGATGIISQMAKLTKDYMGLNAKIVEHRDSTAIVLAMEQKECDAIWSDINGFRQFVDRGLLRPLVRSAVVVKGIEHLPVDEDLTTDPTGKRLFGMFGKTGVVGRVYLATPGTPNNVMNILSEAFQKMLKDPETLADGQKIKMEFQYTPPNECLKAVNFLFNQPPEII
jgi:tripartite-type tricarboxylate transporter receptor subunit TctC